MTSYPNVLSVIPARGGSKGIKLKNLRTVGGIPLVQLAAQVSLQSERINKTIVSTDNKIIGEAAMNGGADFPFYRPQELSLDYISDIEVLKHALIQSELHYNTVFDAVVMLQPTSPFRDSTIVDAAIETFFQSRCDSLWSVSPSDSKSHPLKQLTIDNNSVNYYSNDGSGIVARQQLSTVYHRNGIVYVISRDCILNKDSIMGDICIPMVTKGFSISIHTEWDLAIANFLFTAQNTLL